MTAATFIRPDTHLIFLAGEVAFAESLGEEEEATLFNWLAQWATVYNIYWWIFSLVHTCQAFNPQLPPSTAAHQSWWPGKNSLDSEWEGEDKIQTSIKAAASTPNSCLFDLTFLLHVADVKFYKHTQGIVHDTCLAHGCIIIWIWVIHIYAFICTVLKSW